VNVLSADVIIIHWDSVLEPHESSSRRAVRLGMSLLNEMKDGAVERIEAEEPQPVGLRLSVGISVKSCQTCRANRLTLYTFSSPSIRLSDWTLDQSAKTGGWLELIPRS
jgi:hypothetical protein